MYFLYLVFPFPSICKYKICLHEAPIPANGSPWWPRAGRGALHVHLLRFCCTAIARPRTARPRLGTRDLFEQPFHFRSAPLGHGTSQKDVQLYHHEYINCDSIQFPKMRVKIFICGLDLTNIALQQKLADLPSLFLKSLSIETKELCGGSTPAASR